MDRALRELGEMDGLAAGQSWVHRRGPVAKLLVTIAYIAVVVSYGKYALSSMIIMLLWPALLFQLSGVPVSACFRKLRFVLPLVLAVGLFNPIFDRAPMLYIGGTAISGGTVSMLTLMLKGVLCLMASFLMMATTSIDALCAALRRLRVPSTLVTLLLLTWRYVGVMTEELAVMTDAYHLRAPGQRGMDFSAWGSFLGQLLLRSMDRAEELYASMRLRGFRGEFYYAGARRMDAADMGYLLVCVGAFALFRWADVVQWLGRALVR
ncbi:MAG: cobalt ECF transporter T component CbiQ [Clostridia bacterium]|nr:cobalt ECF transporter T component CbiQ [Clostridia bacterium]